jgi:HTH-type transcriptional regulator, transcriptional repressor of NAD biosynthesis genes
MRRGLVFGKFMPLHRGHQLLIDTALSQCDDLTIVVYDSEPAGSYVPMPIEKRQAWLRVLYPDVENIVPVVDAERSNPDNDDPRYAQSYADALRFLGVFDVVFTSESRYGRFANVLGARHVVVDEARLLAPTSGTTIRENPYTHRAWLDPLVYSSLIQKVVLVGTESAGKSTLARELARVYDTLWTHEYGRELWEQQGLTGTFADHLKIARKQYAREQFALRHSREFLFCDTNAWTTLQWSLLSYGTADARLHELVDRTLGDYIWVVCDNDFGWVDDGTRELGVDGSAKFHADQVRDLERRGVNVMTASGMLDERVRAIAAELGGRRTPV